MRVLPRPTTSPMSTPLRLFRWWAAILTAAAWKSKSRSPNTLGILNSARPARGFVGEVVGHLEVDVVGRNQGLPRPTLLDDAEKLAGDVDAEAVVPPVLEPPLELEGGVVVEHVHVQLALPGEAGEGQVAAAEVADDGVDGVVAEEQVELGVQGGGGGRA